MLHNANLIKKCQDDDLLKRPNAFEINSIIKYWYNTIVDYDDIENVDGNSKSIYFLDSFFHMK